MDKVVFLSLILLVSACVTTQHQEENAERAKAWLTTDNVLHYEGEMEREAQTKLYELYNTSEIKPTQLVITSFGGSVKLGIELGYWVHNNNLDIVVEKYCMSSCANYIFTAANNKYLYKDSTLVWHGGATQNSTEEIKNADEEIQLHYKWWQPKERAFFEHIKVNPLICTYGSKMQLGWIEWFSNYFNPILGFDYSIADLKKFGISNILLKNDHWDWRKYQPQIKVKRLEVDSSKLDYSKSYTY